MPTPGNPRRAFRLDDVRWEEFRIAAESRGWDRGSLLADFVDWYTRQTDKSAYERAEAPFHVQRGRRPAEADHDTEPPKRRFPSRVKQPDQD